jgi:orotate phosphoribosyltransferase
MMPDMPSAADPATTNESLVARVVEVSELHGDFELSSGKRSSVYFDKFLFLTRPDMLRELAVEVAGLLPAGVDHLAAPEGAATLLVAAVSLETGLPVAVVRKEAKPYGTRSQIEGHAPRGARVCLIEDVSTTGHQVQRAAEALAAVGVAIERIVLAIDRGGADHLRGSGYDVAAVAHLTPREDG